MPFARKKSTEALVGEKKESMAPISEETVEKEDVSKYFFHPGVIERGHIYFFYRPKVQHEEVHSVDDVKNLHMLLVPRPPKFSVHDDQSAPTGEEMVVLPEGAEVTPARETLDEPKKHYRLLTIGKKRLPESEGGHQVFWAAVTAVGDDLHSLERGFGEKTYETKTRGMRQEGPVRLAGRGVYAMVNHKGHVPSRDATHLAYHLTHPSFPGDVQEGLGIHTASSFVVQVKNPLADAPAYGQGVGLPAGRRAHYPDAMLEHVFERGSRGRHEYGLRFTTCRCIELIEYEGAELLMIAARGDGDASLGKALKEAGEAESQETVDDVFRELAADREVFPAEPLEGRWI